MSILETIRRWKIERERRAVERERAIRHALVEEMIREWKLKKLTGNRS